MITFPILVEQSPGGWYELACRCGRFSVTIGHKTRPMPAVEIAASIALIIAHARDCDAGKRAGAAARLEEERLRPVTTPPQPTTPRKEL